MPARKADSFESELWTDDSTFSHGEQTVSRPNVHGVCEANESEFSEKKQVLYVRRSGFLAQMIRRLIRMKALDDWRVGGRFLLAIDGTGLYSFRRRHCEHCIETRHDSGAVTYSHKVLVAFIVSDNGYVLPIACEFIENPGAAYDKQDC